MIENNKFFDKKIETLLYYPSTKGSLCGWIIKGSIELSSKFLLNLSKVFVIIVKIFCRLQVQFCHIYIINLFKKGSSSCKQDFRIYEFIN